MDEVSSHLHSWVFVNLQPPFEGVSLVDTSAKTNRRSARYIPIDLAGAPEVDVLLEQLGFGFLVRPEVTTSPGRNDIWIGPTQSGKQVFVKRLTGRSEYISERIERMRAFERFREESGPGPLNSPELIASDKDTGLCVFVCLDGARTGAELAADDRFDTSLAESAGRALGTVHAGSRHHLADLDASRPHMPDPGFFVGLPRGMYDRLTTAEVDTWKILQQDASLHQAIAELCSAESGYPVVPSHGDLRLDQFLVTGETLYVSDWEEFRLTDPARDVGNYAGQWLQRAVLDIVSAPGSDFRDADLTHEDVMERGAANLIRVRPLVEHFWHAYGDRHTAADPDLPRRATSYAGWHLLERLLASAGQINRLTGIERAAAGIGRAALIHPERFSSTIGLSGEARA